jgi:MOSC domain-containing protein YiiM
MRGQILQVNISRGGLPKLPIPSAYVSSAGLGGDAHAHPRIHGGPFKAVLLIASEILDHLVILGYPVFPGAMGENFTTRGIDVRALRIGHCLRAGAALLEITEPRGPCASLDVFGPSIKTEIYDKLVRRKDPASPRWGMSGLYAAVREEGEVRQGDSITLLD